MNDVAAPPAHGTVQRKLDRALEQAADGPEVYRERIDFVQTGLDFTRLAIDCRRLVRRKDEDGDPDGQLRARIDANWEELSKLRLKHPGAMLWRLFFEGRRDDVSPRRLAP